MKIVRNMCYLLQFYERSFYWDNPRSKYPCQPISVLPHEQNSNIREDSFLVHREIFLLGSPCLVSGTLVRHKPQKLNRKNIASDVTESKLLWTSFDFLFPAVGFTPNGITTRPFLVQMLVANTIPRSACPSKIWAQTQCITHFETKFSYWLLMVLGFERSLMTLSRQTNPAMEYTDWNHVSESHFKRHFSVWFRRR